MQMIFSAKTVSGKQWLRSTWGISDAL